MTTDKRTLADVQPGGRVRLGDQALSTGELRRNAHVLVLQEMRTRFTDAGSPSRTAALDAAIAVLSAQSLPSDQTDTWAIKLAREAAFAHSREHAYLPQTREETNSWQPHDWVVAAIKTALLGAPPSPGGQGAVPCPPSAARALRYAYRHLDMVSMRVSHCEDAAIIESALKDVGTFDLNAAIAALQPVPATVKDSLTAAGGETTRQEPVAWYVFADTEHWVTMDESEADENREDGCQVRPLVFGDMNNPPAQAADLERARDEGHDGAIRYVLGYLNGTGDCGSTAYDEILNACGRERIIRSAVEDGELEFTGLGRWVEMYGTAEDRALIDGKAVGNG